MSRLWNIYTRVLTKAPFTFTVGSGFVLAFVGDVYCQYEFESGRGYFYKDEKPDPSWKWSMERSIELSVLRGTVLGPWTYIYYPWLARVIPGSGLKYAVARAALDQFVGSPVVIMLTFFCSDLYNGKYFNNNINSAFSNTYKKLRDQGPYAWQGGAKFWPLVHTFNFRFVPPLHQPIFAHVMSIYWNAILSFYNNKANISESEQEDPEVIIDTIENGTKEKAKNDKINKVKGIKETNVEAKSASS